MRSHFENADCSVEYGRQLLARVTQTPCWDNVDPSEMKRILRAVGKRLHEVFGHRTDIAKAVDDLRWGNVWLPVEICNKLLDEIERAAGGTPLPPIQERLRSAGIQRLLIFEPHHRDSDYTF